MRRDAILGALSAVLPELRAEYVVRWLALFGSTARGEEGPDSDVDILVSFEREPGFDRYLALKWRLEELLGNAVDLVMDDAVAPRARAIVQGEAVRVA